MRSCWYKLYGFAAPLLLLLIIYNRRVQEAAESRGFLKQRIAPAQF